MGTGRELGNEDTRREVCKYQTRQEEVSEPRFSSLGTGDKVHFFVFQSSQGGNIFYEFFNNEALTNVREFSESTKLSC